MTDLTPLTPALAHSRYLQRICTFSPELAQSTADDIHETITRQTMADALAGLAALGEDEAKRTLRHLRQKVMSRLIARELAGLCDLTEAVSMVSDLAEVTVATALDWAVQSDTRYGQPIGRDSGEVQELIVVGMGKLGGRELNVSSDIDLIFIYPEDGETSGPSKIDNHDYFTRIGRKLIRLLSEQTGDGFVFRVDMRLRPFGDSGPLVTSFAALENYLLTQGREWERYAWIKGRALTGDEAGLMQVVTPFVYRKYLDYGVFQSMRELHAQIRREVARRDMADNIKLGPGGIREVEFICQVFQLIRGGRHKALRERATMKMLDELENWSLLPIEQISELRTAYVFLRNLEHRIMYLDDAQTQMLPANDEDRRRIALSMGMSDWPAFRAALDAHRERVSAHFESIFAADHDDSATLDADLETLNATLAAQGYADVAETARRIADLLGSTRYQHMPDRCRRRFDLLLPKVIEVASHQAQPDLTLMRMLALLETISGRETYLALLAEHGHALKRVAQLYSASDWVSAYLTRHPILLDELLDARLFDSQPDWPRLRTQLREQMSELAGDTEAKMDALRHLQHSVVFRLVVQDLAGLLPLETLSDHLSELADQVLTITLEECWRELPGKHRETPLFAVIGYGKLGGKELGYASDLDLVFLYDDPHPGAGELYAKLARRMTTWLTTMTAAGMLYDIDLRLRPNGASGLLVSSMEAFGQYQRESAWVWEHQALTRARFVCGDADIGAAFEAQRSALLCSERDHEKLIAEVVAMRRRMMQTHPSLENDVKYCRGGLVDVEFIVQYLILTHAARHPILTGNKGNIALLGFAAEAGLIPAELAQAARIAYRECRRLQHKGRLKQHAVDIEEVRQFAAKLAAVRRLWQWLFGENPD